MRLRARPLAVAGVLLLLAATGSAYWLRQGREREGGYVVEPVERGSIAAVVTATGTVNPVTTVQVGTYVSGPIRAIYKDFNSEVKRGELVAKIDPASFDVKVRSAEANVATARARVQKDRADLALKKLGLDRSRQLLAKRFISQNDLDTADSNYSQAVAQLAVDEASVKQAQADLEAARINLAYTDITSPVDGVVVSRNVDVGQTVAASFQTPTLFLIAQDLTKMQVNASVSESDIGGVGEGQPATFRVDAYPEKDFAGRVRQVRNSPITVQNVVTYDVVIAVDNPRFELRPGMTATVTITTAERADVLKVPLRALRFRPEADAPGAPPAADGTREPGGPSRVWVLGGERSLRPVEIRTGAHDDRWAELLSGDLHPGDRLVISYRRAETAAVTQPPPFAGGGRRYR
ncbi:MAG: HlyD family secretion protein [Candidatus Binatota bacterium]|nr:HlyD family secretion protein [Candidatus Binatota bacterium]